VLYVNVKLVAMEENVSHGSVNSNATIPIGIMGSNILALPD